MKTFKDLSFLHLSNQFYYFWISSKNYIMKIGNWNNNRSRFTTVILLLALVFSSPHKIMAEDGYDLWLRYKKIENPDLLKSYRSHLKNVVIKDESPTFKVAKKELQTALSSMLGSEISFSGFKENGGNLIVALRSDSKFISENINESELKDLGTEGYLIKSFKTNTIITGNTDVGILYGVFKFIQQIQQEKDISKLEIADAPKTKIRILNHWDNLDRTVERGYAGFSLWDWFRLPDVVDPRYTDYARANASIGINGSVITNVNANALILTPLYLEKIAKLADVFRPYGIKVYLTARFSAPIELDKLPTADPLDPQVQQWWKNKAAEIYQYIPDFGGFLVKANSEGQPGPQNYDRNHAEGANLLADAVAPFGGIVMWRAFVYDQHVPDDRAKQAYSEFKPLDGKFRDNVIVQVKNGAIDFQPREPFHPLFGAMEKSNVMMEFQITQEYKTDESGISWFFHPPRLFGASV